MFRLLKLAFYVVIGYALYELYLGFTEGGGAMEGRGERGQSMSGPGEGMEERSEEASGMSASHKVGRGVVS
ncbi:MAG TPA: hypothetical protein VGQ99_04490 [Tepidisphaeraceae bacterium]|jgi:hypothetical protein|nr:hypothetical protein [Tepidisphaeraceae bacterium]